MGENREVSRDLQGFRRFAPGVYLLAALLYGALIGVAFWPFFFSGKTFLPVDLYLMLYKPFASAFPGFHPYNHFDDDILKFCYLYQWGAREYLYRPYWIPEIFGGIALYANTYASHFSPLNWILPLGPLSFTYPLKLLCSLWIAGISMFSLGRHLRLSFWPALLSGMSYMFSGLFITMLLRWWIPGAYSWVPFLLIATSYLLRTGGAWSYAGAALALAFAFLDGFFQTSASILLAWGTYLLVYGWFSERWRGMGKATLRGFLVVAWAFALSAVMWLPQLQYFYWDTEKGSSRAAGLVFQKTLLERLFSILALAATFFPQILGSPQTLDLGKFFRSHLQDFAPFIGTLPLLFALSTWPRRRENPAWLSLWALVGLGLFIPIATPLDRYLYFRFLAVYIVGIAALAGFGLEQALVNPRGAALQWLRRAGVILAGLIAFGGLTVRAVIWLFPGKLEGKVAAFIAARVGQTVIGARNPDWMIARAQAFVSFLGFGAPPFTLSFFLVVCAVGLLHLWQTKRLGRRGFLALLFAVTGAQLVLGIYIWFGFHSAQEFPIFPDNEVARFFAREEPRHEFRATVNDFHGIKREKELQIVPANTSFFFGYYTLEGFDGVRPGGLYDIPVFGNDALLGQANVKYVITNSEPPLSDPNLVLRQKGAVAIYENRLAQPRARLFHSFTVKPRAEIRAELNLHGLPENSVWLEESPAMLVSDQRGPDATAKLLRAERNQVTYQVSADRPELFVASESFYPGWSARWNGNPVPILRANLYMRAVEVPAGGGLLEFRFEPIIYRIGLGISALAFMLWLGLVGYGWRRSRPVRREQQIFSA